VYEEHPKGSDLIPRAPQSKVVEFGQDKCDDADDLGADGSTANANNAIVSDGRENKPICGPRQNRQTVAGFEQEKVVKDITGKQCVDTKDSTRKDGTAETLDKYGRCALTSRLGDGVCDSNFNHPIFLYDELDCFYSAMQEISGSSIAFSG
jgi:hypothetical protein